MKAQIRYKLPVSFPFLCVAPLADTLFLRVVIGLKRFRPVLSFSPLPPSAPPPPKSVFTLSFDAFPPVHLLLGVAM